MDKDKLKRYEYYPNNPRKLTIRAVIHKMRDFRLMYIFSILPWMMWGCLAIVTVTGFLAPQTQYEDYQRTMTVLSILTVAGFIIIAGTMRLITLILKNKDVEKVIRRNTRKILPEIGDSIIEPLAEDLSRGMVFLKSHNIAVSDNYIIGSTNAYTMNPVVFPKNMIEEVAYAIYEDGSVTIPTARGLSSARIVIQNFYFRLKNKKQVKVPVNDKYQPYLALEALQKAGIKTVELPRK
ncbi:MAG: hypothetical protein J5685_10840 [Clostridiales bacterium]|nr:hypothetical protein [Clostridiales bacterium]